VLKISIRRKHILLGVGISAALLLSGTFIRPVGHAQAAVQNIWPTATPTNLDSNESPSVNLGVKFQSDTAGYISGVRFYKGNSFNGGTHVGSLWTTTGSLLARATFTNETGNGWQDVQFNGSVPIKANQTYIASYFAPQGRYPYDASTNPNSLANQVDNPPLHALASGTSGGNGVFSYGSAPILPIQTFNSNNYWVDVDFTTVYTPPTPSSQASPRPGVRGSGPLLVVTDPTNAYSDDYCSALFKTEGIPECASTDAGNITSNFSLKSYKTLVLADGAPLTSSQVTLISNWVTNGGTLVAMKPNDNLDNLLGIKTRQQDSLFDAYYKVDTTKLPGIETQTMQFHGPADQHALNGATAMATLYSSSTQATAYPAMTSKTVGSGKAIAVMYDAAKSVMLLRDGNPGLAGASTVSTDGLVRFVDRFGLGWLDTTKASIPQADEQQRILANVAEGGANLPRLWYFPSYKGALTKSAIVLTGDDHNQGSSQTLNRFAAETAANPAGCSVANWTCYTSTSYAYPGAFSDVAAKPYTDSGFEVSPHFADNSGCFSNWQTQSQLDATVTADLNAWNSSYPTISAAYKPLTERFHCYGIWNDYSSIPAVEAAHGIKADTNSSCWPNQFLNVAQCLYTGAGIPEQYSDASGNLTGVMQLTTQATDENPTTVAQPALNGLVTNATGTPAYYGYFTVLCHLDNLDISNQCATDTLGVAQSNNVPMVSARQAETFIDARNSSSITGINYAANNVSCSVTTQANNLQLMVPVKYGSKTLQNVKIAGVTKPFTTTTVNGVSYGVLSVNTGTSSLTSNYK
jgi:hypothetical protein